MLVLRILCSSGFEDDPHPDTLDRHCQHQYKNRSSPVFRIQSRLQDIPVGWVRLDSQILSSRTDLRPKDVRRRTSSRVLSHPNVNFQPLSSLMVSRTLCACPAIDNSRARVVSSSSFFIITIYYLFFFSKLSLCCGARALVVFSVYSAIFNVAVAAMSRLLLPIRKV